MKSTETGHKLVHRAGLRGQAVCGAEGSVRLSCSGAASTITCPDCREYDRPKPPPASASAAVRWLYAEAMKRAEQRKS